MKYRPFFFMAKLPEAVYYFSLSEAETCREDYVVIVLCKVGFRRTDAGIVGVGVETACAVTPAVGCVDIPCLVPVAESEADILSCPDALTDA